MRERPFVGRLPDLGRLTELADAARDGRPRVAIVRGPEGIGKTAFLRRFLVDLELREEGWSTALVLGGESETGLSYGLLSQLDPRFLPLLAPDRVFVEPASVGAQVLELLDERQAAGPVCIVLDDVHWADRASLHAILFALRRLHRDRVLTAVAARDDVEQRLPDGYRKLADLQGTEIDLAGLAADELVDAAARRGRRLAVGAAARLSLHTGGNPLHFWELMAQHTDDQLNAPADLLAPPHSVRRLVDLRLASFAVDARRLVGALAVLGRSAGIAEVAKLAGLAEPLGAIDDAVAAGVLEVVDEVGGTTIRFHHALHRLAVYQALPLEERANLHRAAAAAAAVAGTDESLRHEIAAVSGRDQRLALRVEGRAQHAWAMGGYADAATLFLIGARLSEEAVEIERLRWCAVECLLACGDVLGATDIAAGTVEVGPATPLRLSARGGLALLCGRHVEARDQLEAAWTSSGAEHLDIAGRTALKLGLLALVSNRMDDLHRWAGRCTGPEGARGGAPGPDRFGLVAFSRWHARDADGAFASLAWLDAPGPGDHGDDAPARAARHILRLWSDDLEGAQADARLILDDGRDVSATMFSHSALAYQAETEYRAGQWDAAVVHSEHAYSLGVAAGETWNLIHHVAPTLAVHAARGCWDRADALLDEARRAAETADPASRSLAACCAALLARAHGDDEGVLAALRGVDRSGHFATPGVFPAYDLRLEALISLGRLGEAEPELVQLEARAARWDRQSTSAVAARLRGRLESAAGRRDAAMAAFERALRHHARVDMPFELALTQAAHGAALRRAGLRRAATGQLERAHRVLASLDAEPYLASVAAELVALARRPAARGPRPDRRLTAQELAVSRLVAAGLTNREVAGRLVLSVKTIEYHLGNAYAKLDVRSRTQLAGVLRLADGMPV